MTKKEKVELAKKEIEQAELMIEVTRRDLLNWESKLELRLEYLVNLKDSKQ